jgi:hypothetical protein
MQSSDPLSAETESPATLDELASRRLARALGFGFALIYLAKVPPGIYSVDGNAMLAVAESLVTHRGFTVPETMGIVGVGGRIYSH